MRSRLALSCSLELPLVVLVLGFTGVPVEIQSARDEALTAFYQRGIDGVDLVANLLLFVPLGMAVAHRRTRVGLGMAVALSCSVEIAQQFSVTRSPSLIDVAANVLGAAIGIWGAKRWLQPPVRIRIDRMRCWVALALAAVMAGVVFVADLGPRDVERAVQDVVHGDRDAADLPANDRGRTESGRLEANWTFAEIEGDVVKDVSGNGLDGRLVNRPSTGEGPGADAIVLDGEDQYVDIGAPAALRLTGSATITAWIRSDSFPADDAAIVSNLDWDVLGYQLDTTVDQRSRTIGFKLADADGELMARYGATPLERGVWYHVSGVYDASARSLDVYLNGRLDNGCLLGDVTPTQSVSGSSTYVGRRADLDGFEFDGALSDVRVYSRPLSDEQVRELVVRTSSGRIVDPAPGSDGVDSNDVCVAVGDPADPTVAGLVVLFGMLIAFVALGLWPTNHRRVGAVMVSLVAGVCILPVMETDQQFLFPLLVPLLVVAGAAAVVASLEPDPRCGAI